MDVFGISSKVIHFVHLWGIHRLLCPLISTQSKMILSAPVMGMVRYDTGVLQMGAVLEFSRSDRSLICIHY